MLGEATKLRLKVVLIEDSVLLRMKLGDVLEELAGVEVVGGAEDEQTALALLLQRRPQLAIVDLQLRSGSGLGVLKAISREPERYGQPRTVVFSSHGRRLVRERCLALGVDRFFDKATELDELLAYVREVLVS